jgi:hypothetical protein
VGWFGPPLPLAPFTVTFELPVPMVGLTVSVSVELPGLADTFTVTGLKLPVTPFCNPPVLSATLPANPPDELMVMPWFRWDSWNG